MGSFKKMLNTHLGLALYSFLLDFRLFSCRFPLTFLDKCQFIFKKYFLIIKHHFLGIPLFPESNNVSLGKRKYFYGSVFGMAVFQTMIITLNKHVFPLLESKEKPVIVDVGAHLGFFSIPLAFLLKKPTIYALEPVLTTFNLLIKNTKNINPIKVFRLGLLDKFQKMTIYYNPKLLMYSSLFSERFTWDKNPHKEIVNVKTLDHFCEENSIPTIDFLKIDAEGAEEKILKGGSKTLSCTRYLLIECSLDQLDGSTFTSIISCLAGKSFNFQLVKIISTLEDKEGSLLLVNLLLKNLLFKQHHHT